MTKALIVIDVQNDYFAEGAFPLWNAEETLGAILKAVARAYAANVPVVLVQHVSDSSQRRAPSSTRRRKVSASIPGSALPRPEHPW